MDGWSGNGKPERVDKSEEEYACRENYGQDQNSVRITIFHWKPVVFAIIWILVDSTVFCKDRYFRPNTWRFIEINKFYQSYKSSTPAL
jgi:hypothetical protein